MRFLQSSVYNSSGTLNFDDDHDSPDDEDDFHSNRLFYEYILFLSPCMLFSLTAFYSIRKLNSDPSGYMGDLLQNSIFVKAKLCLLMAILYALQIVIAVIVDQDYYWIGDFSEWSLLYLFGITAWYLNSKLIAQEAELGIPQGMHHKVFWSISLIFSIWKLLLPYEMDLLPMILNIIRSLCLLILTAYVFVKPYDSDSAENDTDLGARGAGVRDMLEKLESTNLVQKVCAAKNYAPLTAPLLKRNSSHDDAAREYHEYLTKHKIKIFTQEEASKWLRDLSLLDCTVRQLRSKSVGQIDISYEVTTRLEDEKFVRIHKYADFLYLEEYIHKRCDPIKSPWIDRETPDLSKPDLKNFSDNEAFIEARNKALERYLAALVADPRYMIEPVIEFLGIESPYKDAYLGYNGYLKNTSHKESLAKRFKKDIQEIEMKRFDPLKPQKYSSHHVDDLPFFSCFCKNYQKVELQSHYEYVFVVTDQNDPTKVSWTITKTYTGFKEFHENLEGILGAKMPLFERLVPKPTDQRQTDDPAFIEKRKEGLEKYLNHILKNRSNYKDILYEFLEYHFAARKQSSKNVTPRSSFFETRDN